MEFNQLFNESIILWPDEIDISDGKVTGTGVRFGKLSETWNNAEVKAKLLGEWYDLMTWIIFGNLHDLAMQNLHSKNQIISLKQIDFDQVKIDLHKNLQMEDYQDKLLEFQRDNQM
jgi:hypothetical protein